MRLRFIALLQVYGCFFCIELGVKCGVVEWNSSWMIDWKVEDSWMGRWFAAVVEPKNKLSIRPAIRVTNLRKKPKKLPTILTVRHDDDSVVRQFGDSGQWSGPEAEGSHETRKRNREDSIRMQLAPRIGSDSTAGTTRVEYIPVDKKRLVLF